MQAGELRQRVSVQNRTETSDGHDGVTESWSTVRSRLPAKVMQLVGRDLERARQIDPRISLEVRVRYYRDFPADFDGGRAQLLWHDGNIGDRTLEIVTPPIEVEERETLMMQCREAA